MLDGRVSSPFSTDDGPVGQTINLPLSIFNSVSLAALCLFMLLLLISILKWNPRHALECYAVITAIEMIWLVVQATIFSPKD